VRETKLVDVAFVEVRLVAKSVVMVARVEEKASATAEAKEPRTEDAGMETLPSPMSSLSAETPLENESTRESFCLDDDGL
jgi:hypothetical protein